MGKLGFTPLIGLAVVVALAMVAVFGAMSLTPDSSTGWHSVRRKGGVGLQCVTPRQTVVDFSPDFTGQGEVTYTVTFSTDDDHTLDDAEGARTVISVVFPRGVTGIENTDSRDNCHHHWLLGVRLRERLTASRLGGTVEITGVPDDAQDVVLTVTNLVNPMVAGEHAVQIYDGTDDTTGQEATFDITAVHVMEDGGEFTITYLAQEDYDARRHG